MSSNDSSVFLNYVIETPDTADIPYQLANIQCRLDILVTIAIFAFVLAVGGIVCYMLYRFVLKCVSG